MSRKRQTVITCDECGKVRPLEDDESAETLRLHGWNLPIEPKGVVVGGGKMSPGDLCPTCCDKEDGAVELRKTVRLRLHIEYRGTAEIDVVTRVPRSATSNDMLELLEGKQPGGYWHTLSTRQQLDTLKDFMEQMICDGGKVVAVTPLDWDVEKEMGWRSGLATTERKSG